MATTAGTVFPFKPIARKGMQGSALSVDPLDIDETIQAGDVLVVIAGTRDLADDNTATAAIYGVAVCSPSTDIVSVGTVDRDFSPTSPTPDAAGNWHSLNVALALPGQLFEGNIIETATGDETGVYADNIHVLLPINPSTDGYACIEANTPGTGVVFTMRYRSPQYDNQAASPTWNTGPEAGVGIINPRAEFYFQAIATVFGT